MFIMVVKCPKIIEMFSETNENLDPQFELHLLKIKKTNQFHEGCKV